MLKYFLLLTFTISFEAAAFKGCRLNDMGQNICAEGLALYNYPDRNYFAVVKVLDHMETQTKIRRSNKTYQVDINSLIGNISCSRRSDFCINSRAIDNHSCRLELPRGSIKIKTSFENEYSLIEIDEEHLKLVRNKCLDIIN